MTAVISILLGPWWRLSTLVGRKALERHSAMHPLCRGTHVSGDALVRRALMVDCDAVSSGGLYGVREVVGEVRLCLSHALLCSCL